jgi:hypothetical protein
LYHKAEYYFKLDIVTRRVRWSKKWDRKEGRKQNYKRDKEISA